METKQDITDMLKGMLNEDETLRAKITADKLGLPFSDYLLIAFLVMRARITYARDNDPALATATDAEVLRTLGHPGVRLDLEGVSELVN